MDVKGGHFRSKDWHYSESGKTTVIPAQAWKVRSSNSGFPPTRE
jgi:hypothetical protein